MSVLKEGFGFIETEEHDCELFFPFRFVRECGGWVTARYFHTTMVKAL